MCLLLPTSPTLPPSSLPPHRQPQAPRRSVRLYRPVTMSGVPAKPLMPHSQRLSSNIAHHCFISCACMQGAYLEVRIMAGPAGNLEQISCVRVARDELSSFRAGADMQASGMMLLLNRAAQRMQRRTRVTVRVAPAGYFAHVPALKDAQDTSMLELWLGKRGRLQHGLGFLMIPLQKAHHWSLYILCHPGVLISRLHIPHQHASALVDAVLGFGSVCLCICPCVCRAH